MSHSHSLTVQPLTQPPTHPHLRFSQQAGANGHPSYGGGIISWTDPGEILMTSDHEDWIDSDVGVKVLNSTFQVGGWRLTSRLL